MPPPVFYVTAVLLFIGAAPMLYGYYTLLRLAACIVFGAAAYIAAKRGSKVLPWAFGLGAILFNPIIKVHLPKDAWMFIDIAFGLLLVATAKRVR